MLKTVFDGMECNGNAVYANSIRIVTYIYNFKINMYVDIIISLVTF